MTDLLAIRGLERTSPDFREALVRMADSLNLDPSYIAAVMSFETGGTFDPGIINRGCLAAHPNDWPQHCAVGLIQFMPPTAANLGTSSVALHNMGAVEQLAYVYRFFKPWAGRLRTPGDYYLSVFFPAAVGRSRDSVIASSGSDTYTQNRGLDANGDGVITVADATRGMESIVAQAERLPRIPVGGFSFIDSLAWSVAGATIIAAAWYANDVYRWVDLTRVRRLAHV